MCLYSVYLSLRVVLNKLWGDMPQPCLACWQCDELTGIQLLRLAKYSWLNPPFALIAVIEIVLCVGQKNRPPIFI
jgi:hypothetical protein